MRKRQAYRQHGSWHAVAGVGEDATDIAGCRIASSIFKVEEYRCYTWHDAWSYGVHRTRRDGSSFDHVASAMLQSNSAVSTPLRWIFKEEEQEEEEQERKKEEKTIQEKTL